MSRRRLLIAATVAALAAGFEAHAVAADRVVVEGAHIRLPLDKELTRTAVGNGKRLEVQQINTKEILLLGKKMAGKTK